MAALVVAVIACSDREDGVDAGPASEVSLIPLPESLSYGQTNITLPDVVGLTDDMPGVAAQLLGKTLESSAGGIEVLSVPNEKAFIRSTKDASMAEEAYRIKISADGVEIASSSDKGFLWGVQTLRQIILQAPAGKIPTLTLEDCPKKGWRGFHVDVARHMFTMEYLKKIVDVLSFYKINKLQLHLTDDQGWRIEIKKYPQLTESGCWREFDEYDIDCLNRLKSDPDYFIDPRFVRNNTEYGGYYTQAELRDFAAFAAERGIDVIPEIDMPGHFMSAIRTFPELSCTGEAGWGREFSFPVCAGKTENYGFFTDILDEVLDVFPSEYVHIGADEVEKDNWRKCDRCQALIREHNLGNVDGLQNYFVGVMADYLKSKGRKVMAWDDAFIARDPQNLVYTFWRDWKADNPGKITQAGYPIVFMEWGHFYFYSKPSDEQLRALYEFNCEPQFTGIVDSNMLGYQACVFTEIIPNERKFGQQVFPSLQAFAELAWGSRREWSNFRRRLPWHLSWLNQNGIHYRK